MYAPEKSQKQLNYMLIPAKCIRETFECIGCIGPQRGPKIGKKASKTAKNAQFRALYEPLQARFCYQWSQILFNYVPVLSRHLRKTFRCIENMVGLNVGLKEP